MQENIPLDNIDHNRFNARAKYSAESISKIAYSLQQHGQVTSVAARQNPNRKGKYELVYGHRRLLAAKKLGWETIRAEILNASDQDMLKYSLIENLERENISDFEKALGFERMHKDFGISYERVGEILGISKQSISNYIAMLKLFGSEEILQNPHLTEDLYRITEHHARVLAQVSGIEKRRYLVHAIVRDGLSVRELSRIIHRLRGWFRTEDEVPTITKRGNNSASFRNGATAANSIKEIEKVVKRHFQSLKEGNLDEFEGLHLFEEGYSLFASYPPYDLVEGDLAKSSLRSLFELRKSPYFVTVCDMKVKMLCDDVAIVTLIAKQSGESSLRRYPAVLRGTIVVAGTSGRWLVFHEHYSSLGNEHGNKYVGRRASLRYQSPLP